MRVSEDELGVHQTGIIFEGLDTSSAAQCDPEATNDVKVGFRRFESTSIFF